MRRHWSSWSVLPKWMSSTWNGTTVRRCAAMWVGWPKWISVWWSTFVSFFQNAVILSPQRIRQKKVYAQLENKIKGINIAFWSRSPLFLASLFTAFSINKLTSSLSQRTSHQFPTCMSHSNWIISFAKSIELIASLRSALEEVIEQLRWNSNNSSEAEE